MGILVFFHDCSLFEMFSNKILGWSERFLLPPPMPLAIFSNLQTVSYLVCIFEKKREYYMMLCDLLFPLVLIIFNVHLFIHSSIVWMYDNLYNHSHVNR